MTVTTEKRPPEVILKSLVARASCAVLGFRIPHMFSLLKLDVAKIFEVIFACPLSPLVWKRNSRTRSHGGLERGGTETPIDFYDLNLCDMHGSGKLR